ncbi:MerR family transcriptional regulator, partial [Streptomyces sp. SID2131]|nr:MerR family transcriptional regulator [Streptomyces sp. SID2131]
GCLPDAAGAGLPERAVGGRLPGALLADAVFADLSPAQEAALRLAIRIVQERQEGAS